VLTKPTLGQQPGCSYCTAATFIGRCSSARDTETNEKVAIKKISGCFESPVDAKRMLREVKLLSHLRHENVIGLRDILPPPAPAQYKDVYLVYELMDTDLHQIIRSPQPLSPEHVGYFVYQVCVLATSSCRTATHACKAG